MSIIPPTAADRPASGSPQAVARAHGYYGPMREMPRDEAAAIYRRLYWLRPNFDAVAKLRAVVAAELFDTGVNMGPAVAVTFLQRALTALNRNGKDYPDLVPDGRIGPPRFTRSTTSSRSAVRPAGKSSCCARSRRFRASAIFAWPSAGRPMRLFFTDGLRTGLVIIARNANRST